MVRGKETQKYSIASTPEQWLSTSCASDASQTD